MWAIDLTGKARRRVRIVAAVLTCLLGLAGVADGGPVAQPAAAQIPDYDEPPIWEDVEAARQAREDSLLALGPEIREPFFAFLVEAARGDSLGTWDARQLGAFAATRGRPSLFPLEMVASLGRRRPTPAENRSWPRAAVRAVWELELVADLEKDLPYSILGYHPGTLRGARKMLFTEVHAGSLTVPGVSPPATVTDVVFFRLDQGYLVLDVDGLVDRLLGKALDDSGTVGFLLARHEGRLLGLALSLGKNGRRIYGEFDFRRDRVLPNGRPLARALSAAGRRFMLQDYQGPPLGRWVDN